LSQLILAQSIINTGIDAQKNMDSIIFYEPEFYYLKSEAALNSKAS
jgi:hypothetical protein